MSSGLYHVFVLFCGFLALASSAAVNGQQADTAAATGGNPFAAFLGQSEPQAQDAPTSPAPVVPPDMRLETIVLKFLDATSLKGALDKMVSPYGTVAVNTKTNSVIVCDTVENLAKILVEIKRADRTPSQVMVEVVILDVQLRDDAEIGVNWDFLSADLEDVTYRQSVTGSRLAAVAPSVATLGSATAYNTVGLGAEFSVIANSVRGILHAIQQKRNVEILASPRALVVSGQTATIKAVEEIPYEEVIDTATGGANALTSTKFKEVGVTLQVEAIVTDGNNIFVTIDARQNVRTGESEKGVPVVDTRQANTSLLLQDSQTVILGGLRREEKTKQVNQVPILGDVPLIGLLFRSVSTVISRSELVVLLSPHIHRGGPIPAEITTRVDAVRSRSALKTRITTESRNKE
ncbi:MAG: hypothetical protein JW955_05205 [Sedimentisphaerales bacterium]|nr:hypothetical protein [Sedimentisphaerales bacterium]